MKLTRDGAIWWVLFLGGVAGFLGGHFDLLTKAFGLGPVWQARIELVSALSGFVGAFLRMSPAALSTQNPLATTEASQTLTLNGKVPLVLLVCLLGLPATARAQEPSGQSFARGMSWVTLADGMALKTWEAWKAPDRKKALLLEGGGLAATGLTSLLVKSLVGRERPCAPANCGADDPHKSFWSGHVANACYLIPIGSGKGQVLVGSLLALGTAIGRILGNRHFITDTIAGCAAGTSFGWLAHRLQ